MVQIAYNDSVLNKSRVYNCVSKLKNGEMSIENESRSGRHSKSKTEKNCILSVDIRR